MNPLNRSMPSGQRGCALQRGAGQQLRSLPMQLRGKRSCNRCRANRLMTRSKSEVEVQVTATTFLTGANKNADIKAGCKDGKAVTAGIPTPPGTGTARGGASGIRMTLGRSIPQRRAGRAGKRRMLGSVIASTVKICSNAPDTL
mmetsp:Transcript_2185/g.4598  ORF Transcript_2185/g.4598 Transcript_2185/m.4598 type:complete len:144 (+) Transcript_2185:1504-1935(+)